MPKHGKSRSYKKKSTTVTLNPKNFFAGQIGGWTNPRPRRQHAVKRQFITQISGATLTIAVGTTKTTASLAVGLTDIPVAIRNTYQRVRIQKVTGIFKLSNPSSLSTIQLAVAPIQQGDAAADPLNMPASDVKMISLTGTQPTPTQGVHIVQFANLRDWYENDRQENDTWWGNTQFGADPGTAVNAWMAPFSRSGGPVNYTYTATPTFQVLRPNPVTNLFDAAANEVDVLRKARMYPPVVLNSSSGEQVPLTKENWLETNGTGNWTCFNLGIYRDALQAQQNGTCHLDAQYQVELLCDGQKA